MNLERVRDQLKGMFVGVFLGDALGAPHELRSNVSNVFTGKMEVKSRRYNRFTQEESYVPVGATTDDTEMTLTLLRSIVCQGDFDRDHVLDSYLTWASSGCKSMGNNTRAMLHGTNGKPLGLKGYNNRLSTYLTKQGDQVPKGNGSLMRASPLVVTSDPIGACILDCNITNPNDVNRDANRLYVSILVYILLGKSLEELENAIAEYATRCHPDVAAVCTDRRERDVSDKDKGYVLHALWCALKAVESNLSYSDFMSYVIRKKGDTDTNAAISGAVIGAKLGFERIMAEDLTRYNYGVLTSSDWLKMRPQCYVVSDIDILVEAATALFVKNNS